MSDDEQIAFIEYNENLIAEMEAVGECGHIPPFTYPSAQRDAIGKALMDDD